MRLIEFHPKVYRNLRDLPVIFSWDPDEQVDDRCSIRFLVGVNGTGKTNLLRFLAAIFDALDELYREYRPDNPAYNIPFRLSYRIRGNTIVLNSSGEGRQGLSFTIGDKPFDPGDLPGKDVILPRALMVYTSGEVTAWHALLHPQEAAEQEENEEESSELLSSELLLDEERPPHWREPSEGDKVVKSTDESDRLTERPEDALRTGMGRVFLARPEHLPLALLAAWLRYHADVELGRTASTNFGAVLEDIGLHRLLSFSLQMQIDTDKLTKIPPGGRERRLLDCLYDLATFPMAQWEEEGTQLWVCDLDDIDRDTGHPLLVRMDENPLNDTFQFFRDLVTLHNDGILTKTNLIVQYPPQISGQPERTILAENLSDGELAFLERMALIHLLREEECLFFLDEPDTHFNDDWKRNLVDHIEQTLEGTNSEVVLTTHASITLTDAYPEEVILLTQYGQDQVPLTLAAEPGEIMRSVFGAERSVGKRAMRRIEELIEQGSDEELEALMNQVGPGTFRFKVVEELRNRVSSDQ